MRIKMTFRDDPALIPETALKKQTKEEQ